MTVVRCGVVTLANRLKGINAALWLHRCVVDVDVHDDQGRSTIEVVVLVVIVVVVEAVEQLG